MITPVAACPEDAETLAGLMDELERFYGGKITEPLAEQVNQMKVALLGEQLQRTR